ncbi:hypothetical protein [Sphingobacterium sp. LRF_L2]|uniref:hypothetical protein n=1 Tax=Sphingobacterium sp. LRF_L2 TaxID=3369421 RepID=UPI003F614952
MKKNICYLVSLLILSVVQGRAQQHAKAVPSLPQDLQIKIAEMAAPVEKRAGAKILGYNAEGKFVTLREGSNDFVCLAPKPSKTMLYSYAYPASLDPFMARGRELTAEGKNSKQKNEVREAEIKAGKLSMPQGPSTLFCYWGKTSDLNEDTGEIDSAWRRYVIYVPYATAASTGLPDKPALPGMPWLMDAGSYKAHIMINPEALSQSHDH